VVHSIDIGPDIICTDHFSDPYQLIVVVTPFEKWLLDEDHTSEHAAGGPNIQLVVVIVVTEEELGRLEVPRSDPHVESLRWEVVICEAPVDNDS